MGFDEDGGHLSRKCTLHSSATVKKPERRKEETFLNGCLVDVFWHHGKFGGLVPSPRFRRMIHAVINLWDHRSQSSQCLRTVLDFSMLILRKFDFVF